MRGSGCLHAYGSALECKQSCRRSQPLPPLSTQLRMEPFLALTSALITPLLQTLSCPLPQHKAVSTSSAYPWSLPPTPTLLPTGQPAPHCPASAPGPQSMHRHLAWPWTPASYPAHSTPCPHSPGGIGSLGLCLDGGPRTPQERLGSNTHAVVVVAVERGAVARGWEGPMAPRGGSAPRGAQVVDPAGTGDRWLPVGVGGRTGWSRDVREAAAEKGGSSAPAGAPVPPGAPPTGQRGPRTGLRGWGRGRSGFWRRGVVRPPR